MEGYLIIQRGRLYLTEKIGKTDRDDAKMGVIRLIRMDGYEYKRCGRWVKIKNWKKQT